MVEILGVPLTTNARTKKGEEHEQKLWLKEVVAANRRHINTLSINTATWIHKQHEKARTQPGPTQEQGRRQRTRGSLLLRVPTRQIQEAVIRKGLVIGAEMFPARAYEHSLGVRQCFKCQAWGHTSNACGRPARCGHCAGEHSTKDCKHEKLPQCTNCKGPHPAWNRARCRTFTTYLKGVQTKKAEASIRSLKLHEEERQRQAYQATTTPEGGPSRALGNNNKRPRANSPTIPIATAPGRPRYTTQAARRPSQTRLQFPSTIQHHFNFQQTDTNMDTNRASDGSKDEDKDEDEEIVVVVEDMD
jgi:hypothetical protein